MVSQPQGNETPSLLLHGTLHRERTSLQRLKRAVLVLPLLRMHGVLLGAGEVLAKEDKMCMYLRATGTKAAPGKGRELKPKWKNPSWVL